MSTEIEQKLIEVKNNQKLIENYFRKSGFTQERFFIDGSDFDQSIKINEIQVITISEKGFSIVNINGEIYETKSSLSLTDLEKQLSTFSQFIRTHEKFIVNLNHLAYFSPSPTDSQTKILTFKYGITKALLSFSNADKVKRYFNIKSLNHVEPWNEKYQSIIDENLRIFEKEIRFMPIEELKENFKYQSTGQFNTREFMANMIWEYYNLLQIGKRDPIEGNIRTFWYYLKPTLSKAITINSQSQYGIMIDTFRDLIVNHQLFKYKDFGFISDSEGNYLIGNTYPNIILVGEKAGHLKKLKRLQEEFGVTIAVLGGMPSILSTEYLVDELEKVFDIKEKPVYLITLVDYNPSSAIIAVTFTRQLKHEDIRNLKSVGYLLTPESFTKEELPHVTDQIPVTSPADKTKLKRWMEAGGGVDFGDGIKQPLGIETEALILDFDRLRTLFKNQFDNILNDFINPVKNNNIAYHPENIDLSDLKNDFINL